MLDLFAVLSLAQACAPSVAPETLAAIAHVESRFDPLAIGVNQGPSPGRRARSADEASLMARRLVARGANLDLGLTQINSDNLAWLGLSIEEAFDPCLSLGAAATVLRSGYRPTGPDLRAHQAALRVALSRYNTGHPQRGIRNGYVARVEATAARLSLTSAAASPPAPSQRPIRLVAETPPPAWDVFAPARGEAVLAFAPEPARSSQP